MEKAPGIELRHIWDEMKGRQKIRLIRSLANITAKLSEPRFPACGSLYYRQDLKDIEKVAIDDTFAIGPTTGRSWFDDRRSEIDIYRGPWKSSKELMNGIVQREISCLGEYMDFPRDRQQGLYNGPHGYRPTKKAKLSVLQDTLKVMPYILPKEGFLNESIIWHNDLHLENMFVDANDPTKITRIIDWQAVTIYPLFLTACYPSAIDHGWPKPDDPTKPTLPSNILELKPGDQKKERKQYLEQTLWFLYEIQTQLDAPDFFHAYHYSETLPCQILRMIGSTFDDGEQHIQSLLAALADEDGWKQLVDTDEQGIAVIQCPLSYSQEELDNQGLEYTKWEKDVERKAQILKEIGVYTGWTGSISPHEYDEVIRRLEGAKERFLDRESRTAEQRKQWKEAWPFKD